MTTNRLYTVFSLITLLALVSAGAIAIPMLVGSLNTPPNTVSVSAEQARLEFRRGEWNAGSENIYTALDQHERHAAAAADDPEIKRFIAYASALAEQTRLDQRRGEWYAGYTTVGVAIDPEIQRFVSYSNALAEEARLNQRRGEWNASLASSPAEPDLEQARLQWRATK